MKFKKILCLMLVAALSVTTVMPASAKGNTKENYTCSVAGNALGAKHSHLKSNSDVHVVSSGIFIDGKFYSRQEFARKLDSAKTIGYVSSNDINFYTNEEGEISEVQTVGMAAAAAGTLIFVPGVGEAIITAAGVVIVAGCVIAAGTWTYKTVINYYKEHTKNKRKSTYDKHTKPRAGRETEKKKQKKGWKKRK